MSKVEEIELCYFIIGEYQPPIWSSNGASLLANPFEHVVIIVVDDDVFSFICNTEEAEFVPFLGRKINESWSLRQQRVLIWRRGKGICSQRPWRRMISSIQERLFLRSNCRSSCGSSDQFACKDAISAMVAWFSYFSPSLIFRTKLNMYNL